jgi:hypothetical protein
VGRTLIRWATFAAIANSSSTTTVVVYGGTYWHYNPWYRKALYDGEEVYVLTTAPVGWETEALPEGAETIQHEGQTYYYADWAFFQAASGGGYVVVAAPTGAEVSAIPEEAAIHEEAPEEELDEIPAGSPSFIADEETFYYVNFNLYVEFEENGRKGYVNGEPEIGAQLDALPEGVTTIEEDGRTYYQFDMVFFEEVEDEDGNPFYEVIDSPDGSEVAELQPASQGAG